MDHNALCSTFAPSRLVTTTTLATEHLKCGWFELRCSVNGKWPPGFKGRSKDVRDEGRESLREEWGKEESGSVKKLASPQEIPKW